MNANTHVNGHLKERALSELMTSGHDLLGTVQEAAHAVTVSDGEVKRAILVAMHPDSEGGINITPAEAAELVAEICNASMRLNFLAHTIKTAAEDYARRNAGSSCATPGGRGGRKADRPTTAA